ncbi:MAG TPA: hypothetical protein DDX40_07135 [Rikenellaceae bacterium]|nr:hypothetical protein [Rikenellaceae bacterium]
MIRAYDEIYLEDAMMNFAVSLDYGAVACKGGVDEYYDRLLVGEPVRQFESGNPRYLVGMSGIEFADKVIETTGGVVDNIDYVLADRSDIFWAGWVISYLQWFTGHTFERFRLDGLTIQSVIALYPTLHEADLSKFIEVALCMMKAKEHESPLKVQRMLCGLTQQELADRSGTSIRMIRAYEQGKQSIAKAEAGTVFRLATVLGCDARSLVR